MSKDMLGVSVHEARGVIADLLEKLGGRDGAQWFSAAKRFLRKENPWDPVGVTFVRDMRKEGWKLLECTPRRITSVSDIELVSFLKQGESRINGEEMALRACNELNANFGQEDAEWLLEHQGQIPTEFRKFYLVFPGTVWQDPDGDRYVSYLFWDGRRWYPFFSWLELDWFSDDRLLRLSK